MLQLRNETPLAAAMALFPDEQGVDTLYAVLKGTFALDGRLQAENRVPVVLADEYWGEPGASSVKHASEMHLCKPSTDVVLVGRAWAPGGRLARQVDVTLSAAGRSKTLRVFGNRQWLQGGAISYPEPFESMPLVYEKAYGGVHVTDSGGVLGEGRNPVGVGFRGERKDEEMVGLPLPNVEDPASLMARLGDAPPPAGFGFVAPSWLPRRAYAGTYDEAWQKGRAPYLPRDFDARFFNAAHADLVCDRFLQGGEPFEVLNASPNGILRFHLPRLGVSVKVQMAGSEIEPPLQLETVLIEPDEARLCLTWRAAVPCDKKALKIEEVSVDLKQGGEGA